MNDFESKLNAATGQRVRDARNAAGMTQAQVAAALTSDEFEISAQMVSFLERGERTWSIPNLTKVARLFGVDPRDLLPPDVPAHVEEKRAG